MHRYEKEVPDIVWPSFLRDGRQVFTPLRRESIFLLKSPSPSPVIFSLLTATCQFLLITHYVIFFLSFPSFFPYFHILCPLLTSAEIGAFVHNYVSCYSWLGSWILFISIYKMLPSTSSDARTWYSISFGCFYSLDIPTEWLIFRGEGSPWYAF